MLILDSCIQNWHWTMCWVRAIKIDGDVCVTLNWHRGIVLLKRHFTSGHSGGPFTYTHGEYVRLSMIPARLKMAKLEIIQKSSWTGQSRKSWFPMKHNFSKSKHSFQWCFSVDSIKLKCQVKDLSAFIQETVFRNVSVCSLINKIHLDCFFLRWIKVFLLWNVGF